MNNPLAGTDPTGYTSVASGCSPFFGCDNINDPLNPSGPFNYPNGCKVCVSAGGSGQPGDNGKEQQVQKAAQQNAAITEIGGQSLNNELDNALENLSANEYLDNLISDGSWLAWGGSAAGLALDATEGLNMVSGRGAFLGIQTMGSTLSDFSLFRGPSASSNGINRVLMSLDYSAFGKVLSGVGAHSGVAFSFAANTIAYNDDLISGSEYVGKSLVDVGMFQLGTRGGKYGAAAALSYGLIDLTYGPQNVPGVIALKRDFAQSVRNVAEHLKQNRIENRRAFSEAAASYRENRVDFMQRVFWIPNMNHD